MFYFLTEEHDTESNSTPLRSCPDPGIERATALAEPKQRCLYTVSGVSYGRTYTYSNIYLTNPFYS